MSTIVDTVKDTLHLTGTKTRAYAARSKNTLLAPFSIHRRDPRAHDVQLEILYCGVCHSDLHTVRDEWGGTIYPCVPGHEIVGRVVKTGSDVTKFKEGDIAAIGCLVDSCRSCQSCREGLEQFCEQDPIFTYNSTDKHGDGVTYGGYSESIVADEDFVFRVPNGLELPGVAPLLCAGITTFSPLRRWKVGKGKKVGVVGLGGLGHMALKFANAFGARVVLFTTSPGKTADALRLGADEVVISKNENEMEKQRKSFDFIIDTVSAKHDVDSLLKLLKRDGTLVMVGASPSPLQVTPESVIFGRKQLTGSLIGGLPETQEMLDFCGEHGITSDVEIISIQQINEAYARLLKSDVKYRFVIDSDSLKG